MKKYLVLGKSNIVNHDDKSDVIICDYAKEYYNLKSFVKNNEQFKDNIILYKELLDEEKFCNILKNINHKILLSILISIKIDYHLILFLMILILI